MTHEQESLNNIYLDWFNNFITTERFAEVYGINQHDARLLIDICRNAHRNKHNE